MITNELSDLLMMPLSSYIGGQVWDVIEQTKLFILPFILMMIAAVGQAKKQGVDEGTPAIQAYKHIEVSTIAMFFIILFACKPLGASANFRAADISYKNYSCFIDSSGHRGIGIFNLMDKSTILNGSYISAFPPTSPTLLVGLLNTFSIGITNAAVASIPCTPHASIREALSDVSSYEPDKPNLKSTLKEFDKQCYQKAVERAHNYDKTKTSTSSVDKDYSYDSSKMSQAYDGFVTTTDNEQPLYMTVNKSEWKHNISSAVGDREESHLLVPNKVIIRCSEAAQQLHADLDNDIKTGEQRKNWEAINVTNSAEGDRVNNHTLYNNIVNDADSISNSIGTIADAYKDASKGLSNMVTDTMNMYQPQGMRNHLNGVATMVTAMINSGKVHNYQLAAPLIISILKAILVISIPLILFMTGYNAKTLLTICVAYIAIDFSKFFLELGVFIDDMIMGYSASLLLSRSVAATGDQLNVEMLLMVIGQYANYALLAVWYMFVGWMGVKMVQPMGMAENASSDSNKGVGLAVDAGAAAATGGSSIGAKAAAAGIKAGK